MLVASIPLILLVPSAVLATLAGFMRRGVRIRYLNSEVLALSRRLSAVLYRAELALSDEIRASKRAEVAEANCAMHQKIKDRAIERADTSDHQLGLAREAKHTAELACSRHRDAVGEELKTLAHYVGTIRNRIVNFDLVDAGHGAQFMAVEIGAEKKGARRKNKRIAARAHAGRVVLKGGRKARA